MAPFSNKLNPSSDIKSLAGKVILVTGGNAGIGKETVLQLAKHNPSKIFLAARTESKANDAIASIKSQVPSADCIEFLQLDLASLPSIKAAAEIVKRSTTRLDTLILNAGIMAVPPGKTPDGFEIQLGTNHVGHFPLTKLLLPLLLSTEAEDNSDVRVVAVSSNGFVFAPEFDLFVSTEKLSLAGPWERYGASKAANVLFAAELTRRYPSIMSVSLHPGSVKTDLYTDTLQNSAFSRWAIKLFSPFIFDDIQTVALNQLWLSAYVKKEDLKNGGFYTPVGKLQQKNTWSQNVDYGRKLWEWTESELAKRGF
ncbi:short-chain dehydrogenase/reductase [Xylogone sp. PMI_703]|nr:short-chain dehydrogenase/reductase [Xylogone sp. PMI_703]